MRFRSLNTGAEYNAIKTSAFYGYCLYNVGRRAQYEWVGLNVEPLDDEARAYLAELLLAAGASP